MMDVEQIKEIGKIFEAMSGEASDAFAWYLIAYVGSSCFGWILLFSFGIYVVRSLFGAITDHSKIRYHRMMNAAGHGVSPVLEDEFLHVIEALKEYKTKNR